MTEPAYSSQGAVFRLPNHAERCVLTPESPQAFADLVRVKSKWRLHLWREWDVTLPRVVWVMLNPSIADDRMLDQTLRQVLFFSQAFGFGRFDIVNLFAWQATDPSKLRYLHRGPTPEDAVGQDNDAVIAEVCLQASKVIVGWGVNGWWMGRNATVTQLLREEGHELHCLGVTKEGHPKHPLYLSHETQLERWVD